ncbi:MAG: alpha/beta fold hydrolase [Chloroflexi bacterium]|nr:alpha/beta fold hydrolase [Chloroflexota bacterium]
MWRTVLLWSLISLLVAGHTAAQDAALGAGQHDLSLTYQDTERSYRVYVPEGYSAAGDPLPLVIVMHGAGGNGAWMQKFTEFDKQADAHGFVVAYPDGINGIWNDGRVGDPRVPPDLDDVGFIAAMINDLATRLNIDTARVYATGYSMGGMMAFRLGCELQDKIAAVSSVASTFPGYLAANCENVAPMPVLIIQGTADTVIPWQGQKRGNIPVYFSVAESAVYWALTNGCEDDPLLVEGLDLDTDDGTLVREIDYRSCTDDANVVVYAIIGGGHTWPGTPLDLNMGAVSYDLYASPAIWEFFEGHALQQ